MAGEEPVKPFNTLEQKLTVIEFHYKTTFLHGHKHGKESVLKAVETAQRIINQAITGMRFPYSKEPIPEKKIDIENAWKALQDVFNTDENYKSGYINNISMFLLDRCGLDPKECFPTAKDLLRIIFY